MTLIGCLAAVMFLSWAAAPAAQAGSPDCVTEQVWNEDTKMFVGILHCSSGNPPTVSSEGPPTARTCVSRTSGVVPCTIGGTFFTYTHDCYLGIVPPTAVAIDAGFTSYQCRYNSMGGPIPSSIGLVVQIPDKAPGITRAQAQTAAWDVIASLTMPSPALTVGPAPSLNEWNMAVVGYPLWFWTTETAHESTTATANGVVVTITAKRLSTTFDFGDGASLTCTKMTPYPATVVPMIVSPDCGHVYQTPPTAGSYTIKATAHWQIDWTAAGYSGTEPRDFSQTMALRVGELQSVRVG